MKITFLKSPITHSASSSWPRGNHQSPIIALYVGTIASTKLEKSAVKRNRMRRRCREALRITIRETSQLPMVNCQLLIAPRLSSLTCEFEELLDDTQEFLKYLQKH